MQHVFVFVDIVLILATCWETKLSKGTGLYITFYISAALIIGVTFSPQWGKGSWTRKWCERKLQSEEETLVWLQELPALTPSGMFCLFFSLNGEEKEKGGAREGGHRWPFGLSVWCLGWMSKRERGREGELKVKVKVWKKGAMCSFPLRWAWWLQAVDFHGGLTLVHIALSLQSVWKLRPQRAERKEEEGSALTQHKILSIAPS